MKITQTKKSEQVSAKWIGGTTTQLAIFPATAEYTKFNFIFRMSTATVEIEESTFTFMPGVTRHLMILNGELEINHTERYAKHLKKYDVDVFDGEWPTTAKGKVVDFNLMTRAGASATLEMFSIAPNLNKDFSLSKEISYLGIYCAEGNFTCITVQQNLNAEIGDFLLIENDLENLDTTLHINTVLGAKIIVSSVKLEA